MKSKKRPNIGFILLALILIGAVVYSVITSTRDNRLLETGLTAMHDIQVAEAAALIFPADAIADETISESEMAEAKAKVSRTVAELYDDEDMREVRADHIVRDLERQARQQFFLREIEIIKGTDASVQKEGDLVKFVTDTMRLSLEYIENNSKQTARDVQVSPDFQAIYKATGDRLTLIDQSQSVVSRFLGQQLGYDVSDTYEGDMPWNRRPF